MSQKSKSISNVVVETRHPISIKINLSINVIYNTSPIPSRQAVYSPQQCLVLTQTILTAIIEEKVKKY